MGDPRPRACPHISEPPHPIYEKASLQHFAKESFISVFGKLTKHCEIYDYLKASWPILVVQFPEEENCEE